MTNYAIMRCEKVKSMGQLSRSLKHNFREQETPNADPERTDQNEHDGAERTTEAMGKIRERLPEKRRKDAVIAVEYMMTTSKEWMQKATPEQQKKFFENSKQWLENKYGKENVVLTSIHRDETTPHMAAWVTPITEDGRLCAKDFIGGPAKLRKDQTDYHKAVKSMGLSRGIEGSTAKHERIQTFYSRISNQPSLEIESRSKSPSLSPEQSVPQKKSAFSKESPQETSVRLNKVFAKHWEDVQDTSFIRLSQLQKAEQKSKQNQRDAGKWRKLKSRLELMKSQDIKTPDGKEIGAFVREKVKESKEIEQQEQQEQEQRIQERKSKRKERSKNRSHGIGD